MGVLVSGIGIINSARTVFLRGPRVAIHILVSAFLTVAVAMSAPAQGIAQSPYSGPSLLRGGALDLAPSNPLGMPGTTGGLPRGADSLRLSDRMLGLGGLIPNLQVGYVYSSGKRARRGRLTLDYLLPVDLGSDAALIGEAHGEFTNVWKTLRRSVIEAVSTTEFTESSLVYGLDERTDLSLGAGYRKIYGESALIGVNGFYDTVKLGDRWYSSGSIGFESVALLHGNDALDISFNWYGPRFNLNALTNTLTKGPRNFDFQAGYSHELWNGGPDLRLSATGYKFDRGEGVFGAKTGAEIKTRDGMFSLKYEASHDRVNGVLHTVGGFVNVGLRLSNLAAGKSPFLMPEPIFKSPRNLRNRLTQALGNRDFSPSRAAVFARSRYAGRADAVVVLTLTCSAPGGCTYNRGSTYPVVVTGDPTTLYSKSGTYTAEFAGVTNAQWALVHLWASGAATGTGPGLLLRQGEPSPSTSHNPGRWTDASGSVPDWDEFLIGTFTPSNLTLSSGGFVRITIETP